MLAKYPDYRIVCLDKLTYAGNLSTLASVMDAPNFRFVKADICDLEAVEQLFEEEHPDIVVNFAAESHVDRSIEDPGIFLQTNVMGTAVLMDACRKFGIKRYHQVLLMKFMAIFLWIDLICSLQKKLLSTQVLPIVAPRLVQIC